MGAESLIIQSSILQMVERKITIQIDTIRKWYALLRK